MMKMLKSLLAAVCCMTLVATVPACHRDRDDGRQKTTKKTYKKKETKVKKDKGQPKKVTTEYRSEQRMGNANNY